MDWSLVREARAEVTDAVRMLQLLQLASEQKNVLPVGALVAYMKSTSDALHRILDALESMDGPNG